MVPFLGLLLGLGILGMIRLARGLPLIPKSARLWRPRSGAKNHRVVGAAAVGAVLVIVLTGSFMFAVLVAGAMVVWPLVSGGGRAERAELTKLEALADWTEAMRDLEQKGAGLESVIPATVDTAPDVLVDPLRRLSSRLSVRVPLPHALSMFADDVDHASADLVVAALAFSARQRKGHLSRVLSALAEALRDELEQRTKVMRERNTVRREAAQVAGLTALIVLVTEFVLPAPALETGVGGQMVALAFAAGFIWVFVRVRRLAEPEPDPRLLTSAVEVLEVAARHPAEAR